MREDNGVLALWKLGGKRREKKCEVDRRIIVVCKDVGVRAIERESVGTECRE